MKNKLIPIIILIVLIAGFLFLKKNYGPEDQIIDEDTTPTPEEVIPEENEVPTDPTTSKPETQNYSYTNSEFDFAVDLPGLVATRRQSSDPIMKPTIFTFGVGDQSNIPEESRVKNTMAVYIWKNKSEFDLLMLNITPTKETVNGNIFDVYAVTESETTIYRYATTKGGITYDVGVWNKPDAQKFYLLK